MELCSSDDEETTKKYAVVIANSKYDEDALEASEPSKKWNGSPSFDARMMLRKLGLRNFEVSDFHDQTGEALKKTFSDFVAAFHGRQLKPSAEKESLLLYFSGLGIVKEGKSHILGTDGTLVDIEGFFTGALDATSKVKGNSIVTLLDGSFSNIDSQPLPQVSYVAKESDGAAAQPKVIASANGNLLLCGMGQVSEASSSSGESTPVVEQPKVPERGMSFKGSLSRTMSSSARRFWSANTSGSTTARNFNPNLDRFCSLLDKMESTAPESETVLKTDADPHVVKAAIASRIKDVVSTKASLAQQYKTSRAAGFSAPKAVSGDNTVNQKNSSGSLSSSSEKTSGQKRAIEVPKLKQISSTTARYHAKQTPRGNRTARAAVAGDHVPLGGNNKNRTKVEDVASLCAYLQEGNEPSFLSLKGTMLSMPTGSPAALERWSSTESWLKRQEVSQEAVESGLYSLTPLDGPGTICTISGGSHSLTNMQLCLTDENGKQAIVLDESCTDVKIQDSIFEGGTLILSGAACHVRFSNCSFHFCTLVVRDDAVAELKGTRFESGLSDGAGICLVSTGSGSKVQATDSEVTGGYQAVLVQDGASLDATRLICNGAPVNGIEARGQGTKLTLTDCTVAGCMYNTVMVVEGATGHLQNSILQGSVLRDGLSVSGTGTSVTMRNCELRDNANSGARVCASASVQVLDSFSHGNKKTGFRAQEGGHLTIRDSFSERDKCACTSEGASSVVDGHNFQVNNTTLGFSVLQGACMKLYRCSVKTVDGRGVYVHAGKISITEGKVEGCTQVAVVVRGGGEAILESVEARQNAGGAFQCSNAGSLMCLTKCKTTDRRPYKKSSNGTIITEECEPNLNPDGSVTPST